MAISTQTNPKSGLVEKNLPIRQLFDLKSCKNQNKTPEKNN
jgi:hypothetical protein